MWRPDPGLMIAPVADWGDHPDDLEWEEQQRSLPRKIMKKREVIVKDTQLKKLQQRQGRTKFSLTRARLSEYSKSSGLGEDAASIIQVYYEVSEERKVLAAFSATGIDLEAEEAVPVDPKSPLKHEQDIMLAEGVVTFEDTDLYEEGPPLPPDEIKAKMAKYIEAGQRPRPAIAVK